MNYYEELGLERNASDAAIRDAYRKLCRLLHPDQYEGDAALRRLAECQMRRLNEVHETLADPARRAAYDESLRAGPVQAGRMPPWSRFTEPGVWAPLTVWGIAAVMGLTLMVLLVPGQPVAEVRYVPAAAEPAAPAQPPRPHRPTRRRSATATPVAGSVPDPPAYWEPLPVAPHVPQVEPPPIRQPAAGPVRAPEATDASEGLGGTWFYPKADRTPDSSLYPPEFIEAVIAEKDGMLRGRYRARYRVGDRAISPNVSFRFEGATDGRQLTCPWIGQGGSRGEVTLRLLAQTRLEVVWTAEELGHEMGLISGRAILVRRP
ncbi:MAG: J domain-containing protein [Bryobacterales bacterium]|nr:J domain-containing protein [Bryobacterales bacterium]